MSDLFTVDVLASFLKIKMSSVFQTTGANMTCQLCGHSPSKGSRNKGRSPTAAKKSGKDTSTQTVDLPEMPDISVS